MEETKKVNRGKDQEHRRRSKKQRLVNNTSPHLSPGGGRPVSLFRVFFNWVFNNNFAKQDIGKAFYGAKMCIGIQKGSGRKCRPRGVFNIYNGVYSTILPVFGKEDAAGG